ncbi:MAG: two-component system response regulator [Candidatus Omnitrophota bacterium]
MAQKPTVLIIDDEKDLTILMKDILQDMGGYRVECAGTGEEGLRRVRESRPQLIFLDYVMPKMKGNEVLDCLKQDAELADIPVIFISGLGAMASCLNREEMSGNDLDMKTLDEQQVRQVLQERWGIADFLPKPFEMNILLECAEKVLGGKD